MYRVNNSERDERNRCHYSIDDNADWKRVECKKRVWD